MKVSLIKLKLSTQTARTETDGAYFSSCYRYAKKIPLKPKHLTQILVKIKRNKPKISTKSQVRGGFISLLLQPNFFGLMPIILSAIFSQKSEFRVILVFLLAYTIIHHNIQYKNNIWQVMSTKNMWQVMYWLRQATLQVNFSYKSLVFIGGGLSYTLEPR